jgi:hypothetical protein
VTVIVPSEASGVLDIGQLNVTRCAEYLPFEPFKNTGIYKENLRSLVESIGLWRNGNSSISISSIIAKIESWRKN